MLRIHHFSIANQRPWTALCPTVARTARPSWYSQEKLAEKANLHRNTVGIIERGVQIPTLDVIVKLAHALDMKPYQLIDHIP